VTILNVSLARERALIASNTGTWQFDRKGGRTSKLIALPHINAVLAFRGAEPMFLNVPCHCAQADANDVDGVIDRMFDLLLVSHSEVTQYAAQFLKTAIGDWELLLAGWSPQHGRPVASIFSENGGRLVRNPVGTYCIAPADGIPDHDPDTTEKMIELAKQQYARKPSVEQGCGGHLILAEIECDRLTIQKLCELSPRLEGRPHPDGA